MESNHCGAAVELLGLCKTFPGGARAVDDVSLTVSQGEIMALLGPSGCGKTTTLRLINRLEEADSGRVLVRGRPAADQSPEQLRRSIGYVIQEGGLFPHLSVAENISIVPGLLGWERQRTRRRVREVLQMVGLPAESFAQRRPHELSGGQRQRVGVARALAGDPDLLLMDEPFSALDPVSREGLHDEFLQLQRRLRKTIVVVTHDMLEAGKLADRVALMNEGRVVQQGRIRDLLFEPTNPFVASFFGRHRRQLIFETLRLEDLLEDLPEAASPAVRLTISVTVSAGQALQEIADAPSDAGLEASDGRLAGRVFDSSAVRRRIFSAASSPAAAEGFDSGGAGSSQEQLGA